MSELTFAAEAAAAGMRLQKIAKAARGRTIGSGDFMCFVSDLLCMRGGRASVCVSARARVCV